MTLAIEVLSYGLAVWLGGYLIARNPAKLHLYLNGLGLLAYAFALASDVLAQMAGPANRTNLERLHWFLIFLPAILWTGALIRLLPEELRWRSALFRSWAYAVLPASLLLLFIAVSADLLTGISSAGPRLAYQLFTAALMLPLLAALVLLARNLPQATEKRALGILLTALLFFTLGTGLLLVPLPWLPRLASSPLIRMPLIDARLRARGAPGDTLERAAELKAVLSESITRLKPRGQDDFGASDEWRFFNAPYYPYVVGLHPYSRRATYAGLDESTKEALRWFQTAVPERTLYNWQTAAAKLVAQDLREQNQALS